MSQDILVIGGGVIGATIAWRLAQRGAQVTIVEAKRLGAGASTAGAGMLAPGAEAAPASPWGSQARESLRLYDSYVEELSRESRIPIDYRVCGAVEVARNPQEWAALSARAAGQRLMGIESETVEPDKLAAVVGSGVGGGIERAMFYPEDAVVDPRDLMKALTVACRRAGVWIAEGEPVQSIQVMERQVCVRTKASTRMAAAVVLAAGAWSTEIILEGLGRTEPPRAYPVRGHLIGFRVEPGRLGPILRHAHTYLLQRCSGQVVAGTTEELAGFDAGIDEARVADITGRARELLPLLASLLPDSAWTGFRPGAESEAPVVRRWEDTPLWLAYGHFRNGILLAPLTGEIVAGGISASLGMA